MSTYVCNWPSDIRFGPGTLSEVGPLARAKGPRCLVFTGKHPERVAVAIDALRASGVDHTGYAVDGEPTFESVREATALARDMGPDCIVAVGGGSVIDAAKAVAMLFTNGGNPLDYAEVIGEGKPVKQASLPFIAAPTTAGTGAEVTRNAVLKSSQHKVKVSLRSPLMLASVVLLDPTITCGLPPEQTAVSGMDALSQLMEAFVARRANPWTDAWCQAGIPLALRALPRACAEPDHLAARGEMLLAACWSGLALAHAGLGAVHGFAAAAGGMTDLPHGLICARLLAPVTRANVEALQAIGPDGELALRKYRALAQWCSGNPDASADTLGPLLDEWTAKLPLPFVEKVDVPLQPLIEATQKSSSMKGNPVALPDHVLSTAWQESGLAAR